MTPSDFTHNTTYDYIAQEMNVLKFPANYLEKLKEYLLSQFEINGVECVKFSQWKKRGDLTTLLSLEMPVEEFVEGAISHFDMLRRHQYIAKSQASFLKFAKESIPEQTHNTG